ncbi:MAG: alpha-1,4-glucan--maltose-1-phosphate maltosyltransferase [Rhodospirillales bacterium]|nr:alpha-1,4-glucan--maltose-1-phosphate maltosyltransferase [Rhodospirillales bacterium]
MSHTHKDESARGRADRLFLGLEQPPVSRSIVIQNVQPSVDDGRFPVKRTVGDTLIVTAEIFREGHDKLRADVVYRRQGESEWHRASMTEVNFGLAQWTGSVGLYANTRYVFAVEAWTDVYESWALGVEKKLAAGQNVDVDLIEGREYLDEAVARATGRDREWLDAAVKTLNGMDSGGRGSLMLASDVRNVVGRWPDYSTAIRCDREYEVVVDRIGARYAAWYEMFLRSQGTEPGRSATFAECEARLPEIRAMGFDVIYFPPHHPIGKAFRKGKNNTLEAGPDDPGSPYAIGSDEGGHKAINPELGTLEEFRSFVAACHRHGMEVAMDFAIQCSPDHPWVKEHPEWFLFRPDGSIKYAENPPKKYQDIVNVDFYNEHWKSLWEELKSVVEFWVEQGVKIFRVDNPHTKPVPFWEWMIRDVQSRYPETIFLAEAFTRPPMLYMMAKVGFTQSYTYFTWRHTKQELTEFLTEWVESPVREFARPMFFTNTPDINPPYLQTGGRPAHMIRVVLAATLSSVYGIYNGFELCEATPIAGKEEYLNSEKYEYKVWDWDRDGNIKDYITKLNGIRSENPALHELHNLRFYSSSDDSVLFYGKMTGDRSNMVFVVVNVDPFSTHESYVSFPLAEMGLGDGDLFVAEELFSGRRLEWRGSTHWVRLDPYLNPCEIFRVRRLGDIPYGP